MLFLRFFCIAVAIEENNLQGHVKTQQNICIMIVCTVIRYSSTLKTRIRSYLTGEKLADTSRKPHGAIERLCTTSTSLHAPNGSLPWLQTHHSQNSEKGNTSGVEALHWPAALMCCNGCLRGRKRRRRRRRGKRRKKKHNNTKDPIFTGSLIAVGRVIARTDN